MKLLKYILHSLQIGILSGCLLLQFDGRAYAQATPSAGAESTPAAETEATAEKPTLQDGVSSASNTVNNQAVNSNIQNFTEGEARYERVFDASSDSYQVEADKSMEAKELAEYYGVIVAEAGAAAGQIMECYGTPDPDNKDEKQNPESFDMFTDIQAFEKFSEQVERVKKRLMQNDILLSEENGCKDEQINELLRALKLQDLYIQVLGNHKNRLQTVSTLLYAAAAQARAEDIARMAEIDRGQSKIDSGRTEVAVGWGLVGSGLAMLAAAQRSLPPASIVLAIVGAILIAIGTVLVNNGSQIQRDGERKLARGKHHMTMTCPFSGCYQDAYNYKYHVPQARCEKVKWEQTDDLFGQIAEIEDPTPLQPAPANNGSVQTLPTTYNDDKDKLLSSVRGFMRDFIEAAAFAQQTNNAFDNADVSATIDQVTADSNADSISGTTDIDAPANSEFIDELAAPIDKTYQVMSVMPNTRTQLYDKLAQDSEYTAMAADRIIKKLEMQKESMMELLLKLKRELKGDVATTDGTNTRNSGCEEAIRQFQQGTRGINSFTAAALSKVGNPPNLNFKVSEFSDPGLTPEINGDLASNAANSNKVIQLSVGGNGGTSQVRDLVNTISGTNQNLDSNLTGLENNSGIASLETNNAIRNNIEDKGEGKDAKGGSSLLAKNGGGANGGASGIGSNSNITNNNSRTVLFGRKGNSGVSAGNLALSGARQAARRGKGEGDDKEKKDKDGNVASLFKKIKGGLGFGGFGKGGTGFGKIGKDKKKQKQAPAPQIGDVNKRGFSGNELEHMKRNNPKTNPRYKGSQYDTLWDTITKAYFREGIPRLFDIKKKK